MSYLEKVSSPTKEIDRVLRYAHHLQKKYITFTEIFDKTAVEEAKESEKR